MAPARGAERLDWTFAALQDQPRQRAKARESGLRLKALVAQDRPFRKDDANASVRPIAVVRGWHKNLEFKSAGLRCLSPRAREKGKGAAGIERALSLPPLSLKSPFDLTFEPHWVA